jgi:opacity protein-like surface antigen
MEETMKTKKRSLIAIPVFLTVIGLSFSFSLASEGNGLKWGGSILYGWDVKFFHKQPDFKTLALLPRVDLVLHKNWDLELEGNFSYYGISERENLYLLGGNANILFKPIQWKTGSLFLIGGVGLGYTNSNGRVKQVGDSHVAGLLQIGSGIYYFIDKNLWIRGEYRYIHISDPFRSDPGLNSHNFLMGISF